MQQLPVASGCRVDPQGLRSAPLLFHHNNDESKSVSLQLKEDSADLGWTRADSMGREREGNV